MSAAKQRVDLGGLINADAIRRYVAEVNALESPNPEQARERAPKIIKNLACTQFAQAYTTDGIDERFENMRKLTFPDGTGGT